MKPASERAVARADIVAAYEVIAQNAIDDFNRDGELVPCMIGIALDDQPGTLHPEPVLMPESVMKMVFMHEGRPASEMIMHMVHDLLTPGSMLREALPHFDKPLPSLVVVATEGWGLQTDDPTAPRVGQVKDQPGAIEVVIVMVHTLTGSTMGMCPIDPATRKARYEPPITLDGTLIGRMTMSPDIDPHDDQAWTETLRGKTP